MDRKPYDIIAGNELFNIQNDPKDYLIEGFLGAKDYITIVADPKMGKTILAQQMACSLASGEDFLGVFKVDRPISVWYFATEGRADDLKDRFTRICQMSNFTKAGVELIKKNLKLIPCNFRFNTTIGEQSFKEIKAILKDTPPKAIFIDALYRGIAGSLTLDSVVNEFHHQMGLLQREYCCAIITVHHMTKWQKNPKTGQYNPRTSRDIYGSTFLLGGVDHCIWIENFVKGSKFDKLLRCDDQRSGDIIDSIRVRLRQPEPLGFEVLSKHEEERLKIIELLKTHKSLTKLEIATKIDVSRTILYIIKKELDKDNLLEYSKKEGSQQLLWSLK